MAVLVSMRRAEVLTYSKGLWVRNDPNVYSFRYQDNGIGNPENSQRNFRIVRWSSSIRRDLEWKTQRHHQEGFETLWSLRRLRVKASCFFLSMSAAEHLAVFRLDTTTEIWEERLLIKLWGKNTGTGVSRFTHYCQAGQFYQIQKSRALKISHNSLHKTVWAEFWKSVLKSSFSRDTVFSALECSAAITICIRTLNETESESPSVLKNSVDRKF